MKEPRPIWQVMVRQGLAAMLWGVGAGLVAVIVLCAAMLAMNYA